MKKSIFLIVLNLYFITVFSQGCLPDGIILSSQAEVDLFPLQYPACTTLEGSLILNGADITDLTPLSQITSIGDTLAISECILLNNLEGLHNLTSIGKGLWIIADASLSSLEGLRSLHTVGSDIIVQMNPHLQDFRGLENLESLDGDLDLWNNEGLISFNGLNSLALISGNLKIVSNKALETTEGLNDLKKVNGDVRIVLNPALNSLDGFASLDTIEGNFTLEQNETLLSLNGLQHLKHSGKIVIISKFAGTDLRGLDSLRSIGERLLIYGCPWLITLHGLENLRSIGDYLEISSMGSLTDIHALDSLNPVNVFVVSQNPLLCSCSIPAFCTTLADPSGNGDFGNNGSGCSSNEEVKSGCNLSVEDPVIESDLQLYPNPTTGEIHFRGMERIREVIVMDPLGNIVFRGKPVHDFIRLQDLQEGIYFAQIFSDKISRVRKIIVE